MSNVFTNLYNDRHEYARQWKERTGGKVIGTFCTYVPEELMLALNILPVRILAGHEPLMNTERHITSMYCPFCRGCLSQGLKGTYDYLDGIVIAQSCLHIRQTFNSWKLHIPISFSYYLNMPQGVQSPSAVDYMVGEVNKFKIALEEFVGRKITDDDLKQAIDTMNKNRKLLKELYMTRKEDFPRVDGLTAMHAALTSQVIDKKEASYELDKFLRNLPKPAMSEKPIRLMLVGSENDDTEFIEMAESLGASIVIDDHCSGTRYFWNEVEPKENMEDMIKAISKRYVERVACPSKDWPQRTRVAHILKLVEEYDVQGVIILQQKFCAPHETDIPLLRNALDKINIVSYVFELDVTTSIGPMRIRLEALLEMLNEEMLY